MRYYVISSDGQRYGPADLATLNAWAQQGRLLGNQLLEDETNGVRIVASSLPGLIFPQAQSVMQHQPYTAQPKVMYPAQGLVSQAWMYGVLGLLCSTGACCCGLLPLCGFFLAILGMVTATKAHREGNPQAGAAKGFNVFVLVVCIAVLIAVPFILANQGFSLS